jgi:hypothetical protein
LLVSICTRERAASCETIIVKAGYRKSMRGDEFPAGKVVMYPLSLSCAEA